MDGDRSVHGAPAEALHDDSAATADHIDDILESYNFVCHPEMRVKFIHEFKSCRLGFCLAKPWDRPTRMRITVKPQGEDNYVAKYVQKVLLVPTHSQVCMFSSKIHMGWLRLQFMAGFNWAKQRPTLDYRITTKWSDGPRFKRKERYKVTKNSLLRCKWNMDLHLPDLEGHLGNDEGGLEAVDVDYGRLDFEISQLDLVLGSSWSMNTASIAPPPPAKAGGLRTQDAATSSYSQPAPNFSSSSVAAVDPVAAVPLPDKNADKHTDKHSLPPPPEWWDNFIGNLATRVTSLPLISSLHEKLGT